MDPDIDVCQTEQPQISYSVDFTAEQSSAMGSPILLDREGTSIVVSCIMYHVVLVLDMTFSLQCKYATLTKSNTHTSSCEYLERSPRASN